LAEAFSLQSWDNEFTDWVTVSNVAELPDRCKLQDVKGERTPVTLSYTQTRIIECSFRYALNISDVSDWPPE